MILTIQHLLMTLHEIIYRKYNVRDIRPMIIIYTLAENLNFNLAMKDIVVAIDFSKGSIHALEYAIELANLTHANINMVWVDNISGNELAFANESKELRNEAKGNFDELITKYKDKLTHGKFATKVRKGRVYQELATYLKQNECCLLIVGTHGTSGFEEYWIGSDAFRIVSVSSSPVITVKYNYEIKRGYRKILVPVYHTAQTLQKLSFTADLAKSTGADIIILGLNSSGLKSMQRVVDSNIAKVEKLLTEKGVSYIVDSINSENVAAAIIEHGLKVDADLIAIMTDIQDQASSILLGPIAQQLINYSPVPVLSIHPKDITTL
jgi:nucleotide-binding universal stress UspA family protein